MTFLSRRTALVALSALALVACGDKTGASTAPGTKAAAVAGDHTKGSPDAKITIIEYASPTCPACKFFHESVLPEIETNYVDTGKVQFIFREYPIHGEVDVASYVLAMCAGEDKYFDVLGDLFDNQDGVVDSARNGLLKATLQTIGKRHGIETEAAFDACMKNRDYRVRLADTYQQANDTYAVDSTPTFVINGSVFKFDGELRTAEGFSKHLDGLLADGAGAPEQ